MIFAVGIVVYLVLGGLTSGFLVGADRLPKMDGTERAVCVFVWPVIGAYALGVFVYEKLRDEQEAE